MKVPNSGLCVLGRQQSENQRKKIIDKHLDFGRELKKLSDNKVTVIPVVIGVLETIPKGLVRELEELEIEDEQESSKLQHC